MQPQSHWEEVYQTKRISEVSWYQEHASLSLALIQQTGVSTSAPIIDVGGGASTLVDDLLNNDFQNITVLDIAATALEAARQRLGVRASQVNWIEADVTQAQLPHQAYDVWHDRATFHFLTSPLDRQRYIDLVKHSVKPGGHVIVATFASDGPSKCSGLNVMQYEPEGLHREFGSDFALLRSLREQHITPAGHEQRFIYCYCRLQD